MKLIIYYKNNRKMIFRNKQNKNIIKLKVIFKYLEIVQQNIEKYDNIENENICLKQGFLKINEK